MIDIFPDINAFIRKASFSDALKLSQLTNELTSYIFGKETPKWFEEELLEKSFEERILSDKYEHFVYVLDKKIVGFIAIKNKNLLFHLFVDSKYHKKGIAKKLWTCVKEHCDILDMRVNASLYGIKTYESFGFVEEGEEKLFQELKYQPMIYKG